MIIRYWTLCPGCEAKIVLRLTIGIDKHQPFYYVCDNCGAVNQGAIEVIHQAESFSVQLSINDQIYIAPDIDYDSPDQVLTIALDLPCSLAGSESPASQFPFLHQDELMGGIENLLDFQNRISTFRSVIQSDWIGFKRLITYYVNRNWKQFDKEWSVIFQGLFVLPQNDLERHDCIHLALEMFFAPIEPEFNYPIVKAELNYLISKIAQENPNTLKSFSHYLIETKKLDQLQRSLLERISFVIDNFSAIAPGFPALFYDADGEKDLINLRIMRDDFEILKAHYLSSFEVCHKVLYIVIGLLNINARGNFNSFYEGKPSSLTTFEKLSNSRKVNFIDQTIVPEIHSQWENSFDRHLRNCIGHNSVYHDLKTGLLILDNKPPIPYSKFVVHNLKLIPMLLYCIQVVKRVYILNYLMK